jgi:hypothetical protein
MPLSHFAMMDSVMTRTAQCVVASPGPELQLRVGAIRFAPAAVNSPLIPLRGRAHDEPPGCEPGSSIQGIVTTKVTESLHGRHSYMGLSRRGSSSGAMRPSHIGIPHVPHGGGGVMGTKRLALSVSSVMVRIVI